MTTFRTLALTFALAACSPGQRLTAQSAEKLVPANFAQKTDSQGFRWDINQQGSVDDGTNDCFDGALVLTINGQQFATQQPMMTADGSELVLAGRSGALEVTRRVRLDPTMATVRYVEVLKNPTRSAQNIAMILHCNMGGAPQPYITDRGNAVTGILGKDESGIVAFENPGNSRPSVFFYLCGPRSKLKPRVTATNGNDDFQIAYSFPLPAGKTISILHVVAQRRFPTVPDPKLMATEFKPIQGRKFLRDLPAQVRRSIANTGSAFFLASGGPMDFSVAAAVGLEPESSDVLAYGEESRLRGTAICEAMVLKNRFGQQELELDDVAAIVGNRRLGRGARVFLRDGQVLSGSLEIRGLRFTENTGPEIPLSSQSLDRLVTRMSPDDGRPIEGAQAYVETYHGDRIAVAYDENVQLGLITPWGMIRVALDEVSWFRPSETGFPGYEVSLKDGSRFFAYLEGKPLKMRTLLFGNQSVETTNIRALKSASLATARDEGKEVTRPHLITSSGHVLVGQIDLQNVQFQTAGEIVEIAPSQIRLLRNMSDESALEYDDPTAGQRSSIFGAEMWGGSVIVGVLPHEVLPLRLASQVCEIPVFDIAEIHVPTPTLSDSLRTKINRAIRDLGHADWKKRQRASQELQGYGYLAKNLLQEAMDQTNDPEVRRRCEAILTEISD